MTLVFDTETTGKANFNLPPSHKSQPRIVQLGAQLLDADYIVRGEINLIIRPDGFTIPKEASNIHGITTEIALKYGVSIHSALSMFFSLWNDDYVLVAHNISFDQLMINAELSRQQATPIETPKHTFCTMHASTPICKIPGNYGDYKWPQLQEAYRHFFGESFDGAHDAMADVRACARVYRKLMETAQPPKP